MNPTSSLGQPEAFAATVTSSSGLPFDAADDRLEGDVTIVANDPGSHIQLNVSLSLGCADASESDKMYS